MNRSILRTITHLAAASALVASGAGTGAGTGAGAAAGAGALAGATLLAGQQPVAASVFTAQQATAGKAEYARSCASCHMPDLSGSNEMSPLAGTPFMSTWGARSTKELFDYISASMPYGAPPLSTGSYESIVAYVLQFNGAPAGRQPLSAATDVAIRTVTAARTRD
jgi:mono/diheme cytochrome c family protein